MNRNFFKNTFKKTPKLLIAILISVVPIFAACGANDNNGPGPSSWRFAKDIAKGDLTAAANETTDPAAALKALKKNLADMSPAKLDLKIGQVHTQGSSSSVDYLYQWNLPKNQIYKYNGSFPYIQQDGVWKMRWVDSDINPTLGSGQSLQFLTLTPNPIGVSEENYGRIMVPGVNKEVMYTQDNSLDPQTLQSVAEQLAFVFRSVTPNLTDQEIMTHDYSKGPMLIADIPDQNLKNLSQSAKALQLPGVSVNDLASLHPTDPNYAPALYPILKNLAKSDNQDKSGWLIRSIDENGNEVKVLDQQSPLDASDFVISLDHNVQAAAQNAVSTREDTPVVMVAIQPSSGRILAVAENQRAVSLGPIALQGLYPPGSTFKMVTATAALESGLSSPDKIEACPGTIRISTRVIPNENEFDLGNVPLRTAFADSCNTTFAHLASEMSPDELQKAGFQLGLGDDFKVPGLTMTTGKIIPSSNIVMRLSDGFGQGQDLVTPIGMALVAASIDKGSLVTPRFLMNQPIGPTPATEPIDPKVISGLKLMMRQVVTDGTATGIKSIGQVYGKTGEAEFNGGSHSWFAGFYGDIAFATLIVDGGSSNYAVDLTKDMLANI